MKFTVVQCFLVFCTSVSIFVGANAQCNKLCVDRHPKFCLARQFCGNLVFKLLCPLSCKLCVPCAVPCVLGPCVDTITTCAVLRISDPLLCHNFREECKLTCGSCCKLPPPPTPCSLGCDDKDPINCPGWKSFCDSKDFPDTKFVCPLSCGKCKRCSLPPTTSATYVSAPIALNATSTPSSGIVSNQELAVLRGG